MEKMQEFIDYIFFEVWCKAPEGLLFGRDLFAGYTDLEKVIASFGYSQNPPQRGKQFFTDIKNIYTQFADLSSEDIQQLRTWYRANNDIEAICNNPNSVLLRYTDLSAISYKHSSLSGMLAEFFKGLYSQSLLRLEKIRDVIGEIDDHYEELMKENGRPSKCPFCGITDMLVDHSKRDSYDHYLPKALYPFNSINFRNLAPACHHCNSSYKSTKEPSYKPKDPAGTTQRRKAFYPYSETQVGISVAVNVTGIEDGHIKKENIQLTFGPETLREEISTWCDLYGIEERYKAKCSGRDGKDWLETIRIQKDKRNIDASESINDAKELAQIDPLANSNFLKVAFLEGCHRGGLLEAYEE